MTKDLRKQILALQKQQQESDSIKERRNLDFELDRLTETLEEYLINSPIKVKISYEVTLNFCELPNYDIIVDNFIEYGNLNTAIMENVREIEIDGNDLKIEIQ